MTGAPGKSPGRPETGGPGESPGGSEHTFIADGGAGVRLDSFVAARADISRTQAATLIATGQVTVAGRREKASYRPLDGERVEVRIPPPPGRDVVGESIPLQIVYEDDAVLVVDKAAGMVVHPAPGNWTGTLVNALKGRGSDLSTEAGTEREGIVHRLDRDTSGLLLVAKTDRAHRVLSAALAARRIRRRYAVLSWGHLNEDVVTVDKPIARSPRDRKRMAVVSTGRAARTDFHRLARFDSTELLRAHLHSGRTHQIRIHLASIGHPVVGDETYGGGGTRRPPHLPPRRHFLHAAWLVFRHPESGDIIDLRAPLPPDLRRTLAAVAGDSVDLGDSDPLDYFGFFRTDD